MLELLNQGLLGFLFWLNSFFHDFGISLIVFTLILKIVFLPLNFLIYLEELKLQKIRPKIKEILKKYKDDFQKQAEALTELYQKENYNPFFTLIIQLLPLPIFFAVFYVLNNLLENQSSNLVFLNVIDLTKNNLFLILAVIVFQFLSILNLPSEQRKFAWIFFVFVILILIQFPALFNLYWLTYLVLSLLERILFRLYQVKFGVQTVPEDNS